MEKVSRILVIHDGEYVDDIKEELLRVYPDLSEKEDISTSDREFSLERILEDPEIFDAVVVTDAADSACNTLRRLRKNKRPIRIILIHHNGHDVLWQGKGIEIVRDIKDIH